MQLSYEQLYSTSINALQHLHYFYILVHVVLALFSNIYIQNTNITVTTLFTQLSLSSMQKQKSTARLWYSKWNFLMFLQLCYIHINCSTSSLFFFKHKSRCYHWYLRTNCMKLQKNQIHKKHLTCNWGFYRFDLNIIKQHQFQNTAYECSNIHFIILPSNSKYTFDCFSRSSDLWRFETTVRHNNKNRPSCGTSWMSVQFCFIYCDFFETCSGISCDSGLVPNKTKCRW